MTQPSRCRTLLVAVLLGALAPALNAQTQLNQVPGQSVQIFRNTKGSVVLRLIFKFASRRQGESDKEFAARRYTAAAHCEFVEDLGTMGTLTDNLLIALDASPDATWDDDDRAHARILRAKADRLCREMSCGGFKKDDGLMHRSHKELLGSIRNILREEIATEHDQEVDTQWPKNLRMLRDMTHTLVLQP